MNQWPQNLFFNRSFIKKSIRKKYSLKNGSGKLLRQVRY